MTKFIALSAMLYKTHEDFIATAILPKYVFVSLLLVCEYFLIWYPCAQQS